MIPMSSAVALISITLRLFAALVSRNIGDVVLLASKTTLPGCCASMVSGRLMQMALDSLHTSSVSRSYVPGATTILPTARSPRAA